MSYMIKQKFHIFDRRMLFLELCILLAGVVHKVTVAYVFKCLGMTMVYFI